MSSGMPVSNASQEVFSLYEQISGLQENAKEFNFPIQVYIGAANKLLGDNPQKTISEADPERLGKLKNQLETLAKVCIGQLGKLEVEYYVSEFNKRAEHFTEETLQTLQADVDRVAKEALSIFQKPREHTLNKFWSTYHSSSQYITCAANLVSRQIAFSNIVVSAKHKEEARGSSQASVNALISQAKIALKLEDPKTLIPSAEISDIERRFLEDTGRL